jgi:bifunctional ADP-heptose synthase (sugar kinase/adenylyltransferase)
MAALISATMARYSTAIPGLLSQANGLQGHAGAMLQARQLGKELLVGIHSDEAILENKGPTVMTLKER